MNYRRLGNSGLKVSPLCLGTMNFGPFTEEKEAFAIMDAALGKGINFFDTANVYGRVPGEGVTEKIVGRWLAQGENRRERIILATKVYGTMNPEGHYDPNLDRGLSAHKIIRGCESSLKRLQTDCIDLFQMHHIDRDCPVEEILGAMEVLVTQGKVRYIGSSNFAGWDIATYSEVARRRGSPRLISEQSVYSLENRMVELEVLPSCQYHGLGVIPWSPLSGGLLGGVLKKLESGRRASKQTVKRIEDKRATLEKWEALCDEMGQPPAGVALAWLLHNPAVTAPIIGPRTIEQLESVLDVPGMSLDGPVLERIETIWPGPGGAAPNAYAW